MQCNVDTIKKENPNMENMAQHQQRGNGKKYQTNVKFPFCGRHQNEQSFHSPLHTHLGEKVCTEVEPAARLTKTKMQTRVEDTHAQKSCERHGFGQHHNQGTRKQLMLKARR